MARRKPLYFTISTMDQIINLPTPPTTNNYGPDFYLEEFNSKADLNKFYNKFVKEFNKKHAEIFKIKRCNFHYDQYGNPIEDIENENEFLEQFKVINTGRALKYQYPIGRLDDFVQEFINHLAAYVNLEHVVEYLDKDDPYLNFMTKDLLSHEIEENSFCVLASIKDKDKYEIKPVYRPLIKFLRQEIGLNNNLADLQKGFANGTFINRAKKYELGGTLDNDGKIILNVRENTSNYSNVNQIIYDVIHYAENGDPYWHKNPNIMLKYLVKHTL